jgi:hypothetical protein
MAQSSTKSAVKERLRAEGRWKEALAFREGLKAQGVAAADAYARMLEAYPPLAAGKAAVASAVEDAVPEEPPVKRRRRRRKRKLGRLNWRSEVEWVYLNLSSDGEPDDAPTGGAEAMLEWARQHPGEFFRTFVMKLLPREGDDDPRSEEDRRRAKEGHWDAMNEAEKQAEQDSWRESHLKGLAAKAEAGIDPDDPYEAAGSLPAPSAAVSVLVPVPARSPPQPTRPPDPVVTRHKLCAFCERHGRQPDCLACHMLYRDADRQAAARARTRYASP